MDSSTEEKKKTESNILRLLNDRTEQPIQTTLPSPVDTNRIQSQHVLSKRTLTERNQQLQRSVGTFIQHAQKRAQQARFRQQQRHHVNLQQQQQQQTNCCEADNSRSGSGTASNTLILQTDCQVGSGKDKKQGSETNKNNIEEVENKKITAWITSEQSWNAIVISPSRNTQRITLPTLQIQDVHSLPDAVALWLQSTQQLLQSREFYLVVQSSILITQQTGSSLIHTATLPMRCSWNCTTTICAASVNLLSSTVDAAAAAFLLQDQQHQSTGEDSEEESHYGFLHNVVTLPVTIMCLAGKIIGSVVAPTLHCVNAITANQEHCTQPPTASNNNSQSVIDSPPLAARTLSPTLATTAITVTPSPDKLSYEGKDVTFLDRLRLDYIPNDDSLCVSKKELFPDVEKSQFLLRVNDLEMQTKDGINICWIDLDPKQINDHLVTNALDQLSTVAISLLANHSVVSIDDPAVEATIQSEINWQTEGSTKKILRNLSHQKSSSDRVQTLLTETCVWSGRFVQQSGYGRNFNFFLAHGAICMNARDLLNLLWDNSRTSEYNNYCLGRSTLHTLHGNDDVLLKNRNANVFAVKIIQSEMRVPFAGITVKAICLMHVRPIPWGGFIILSRTLDTGTSGTHLSEDVIDENCRKNEILWGCNIIRPIHSNTSTLTSISQVGSSIPNFLANKIGMMGISDFFKNVRAYADKQQKIHSS